MPIPDAEPASAEFNEDRAASETSSKDQPGSATSWEDQPGEAEPAEIQPDGMADENVASENDQPGATEAKPPGDDRPGTTDAQPSGDDQPGAAEAEPSRDDQPEAAEAEPSGDQFRQTPPSEDRSSRPSMPSAQHRGDPQSGPANPARDQQGGGGRRDGGGRPNSSGRPDRRPEPASVPVGVRFRRAGKIYFFKSAGFEDLSVGDDVVVDTARGQELGWVAIAPGQVHGAELSNLKGILRRATPHDLRNVERLRRDEPTVLVQTRTQIAEHGLPMKAVLAEYSFDGSQLTVYFVSEEHRVDFRDLVRDLARALRTRVHLRQIGARDQAKMLGGIDRCGRELCCTTWIPEFQPVTIRMAKNQNLPLNPTEISGVCGKLLCCLTFEDDQYKELNKGLPKVGSSLTSAVGRGRVIDVNALTRKITIAWEDGSRVEVDAEEFIEQQERRNRAFGNE